LFIGFSSFSQKGNITDAAMRMKKYNPMSDAEKAKKMVTEAKEFIDKAAVHPETSESMKMHLYRGMVYFALIEVAQFDAMNGSLPDDADQEALKQYEDVSKESFSKVINDPKGKYTPEAEQFIDQRVNQYFNMGLNFYNQKNYEMAFMMFLGSYEVNEFIGKENKDAKVNALATFNYVSDSLMRNMNGEELLASENFSAQLIELLKDFEEGSADYINTLEDFANTLEATNLNKVEELATTANESFPGNMIVLTTFINVALKQGDKEKSEKYINQALEIDPNNKELYYILGTSYIDLKENEKAEENLLRAIELDSAYINAHSNLAALYMAWSLDLADEAKVLDYRDPRVTELENKKKECLIKAIPSLEIMAVEFPDNKSVIRNLAQAYRASGNEEKFKEWYDKLKN
jgi:tetratricopeptide (TPR) repeat protein